ASQQGENALRQQIQRCNEQREQYRITIQNLTTDKQALQRKCLQIERELFQLRERFDALSQNRNNEALCDSCRKYFPCNCSSVNNMNRSNSNADKRIRPPVPMPRYSKESPSDRELRNEVEGLREEVSTLRDTLNEQINLFTDERKRWEEERIKILKFNNSSPNRNAALLNDFTPNVEGICTRKEDLKVLADSKSCLVSCDRLI
ncbi:unnamed protein product, partial [Thelazia callipaeda]|uniref:Caspase recruitment domain-containing protein 11 n=1 Tax=Thelazia callipaeda TaxID=103827 RepID=A0A0N5CNH1_THECL